MVLVDNTIIDYRCISKKIIKKTKLKKLEDREDKNKRKKDRKKIKLFYILEVLFKYIYRCLAS